MKRFIPLLLLLVTGCAGLHTNTKEADVQAYPAQTSVPVFLTYGPNLVGYETIIDTNLNEVRVGGILACNFKINQTDHFLFEGTLHSKDPMVMDTHRGFGLPLTNETVSYCLTSETQVEGYEESQKWLRDNGLIK